MFPHRTPRTRCGLLWAARGAAVALSLCGGAQSATIMTGPWTYASCSFSFGFGAYSQACSDPKGSAAATVSASDLQAGSVHLGVQSQITLTNHTGPYNMGAAARVGDIVTLSGPLPQYQVQLVFEVTGSLAATGALALPYTTFSWLPYGADMGGRSWNSPFWQAGSHTYVLDSGLWGFATDTPYNWVFSFGVLTQGTGTNITGSASADFSGSAVLVGGVVTDMEGNPVSGVTYTTASGYSLPLAGAQHVPEPSTGALVACGVWLLNRVRGRRSRR